MARKLIHHPAIVWPVLMLVCIPIFVWSFLVECKSAAQYAWLDSFACAADNARRITRKEPD